MSPVRYEMGFYIPEDDILQPGCSLRGQYSSASSTMRCPPHLPWRRCNHYPAISPRAHARGAGCTETRLERGGPVGLSAAPTDQRVGAASD
jgi:hypothetical protein